MNPWNNLWNFSWNHWEPIGDIPKGIVSKTFEAITVGIPKEILAEIYRRNAWRNHRRILGQLWRNSLRNSRMNRRKYFIRNSIRNSRLKSRMNSGGIPKATAEGIIRWKLLHFPLAVNKTMYILAPLAEGFLLIIKPTDKVWHLTSCDEEEESCYVQYWFE